MEVDVCVTKWIISLASYCPTEVDVYTPSPLTVIILWCHATQLWQKQETRITQRDR